MKQKNEGNFKSKKVLIAFMEFIIAIGCLIALFAIITPKERITETSYSYSRPEEVSRYVVVNEYITRIRPQTEYETFKTIAEKTLDSKIKVYSDAEKTKEITEGYISTGMLVETEEGEDYKANVIGDMTKNGDCNVAELTQIIRQIVGLSNLNEEQKLSADFNGDNIINITDVSMCINYIVYGEMEADKVPPEKPEIKIEGEGNKNAGWYRSEVKVEIEEKEEGKTEKTITTVEMEYDGERPRTQTTEEKGFILSKEGRYKITSQSYGKNGTKSEIETKEIVIDKTKPEFISLEKERVNRESCKLLIEAEDNKGIAKYKVIKDGEEQRVIAVDTKKEISEEITITENGRYKIIIEDVSGNEIEREINITDIEKDEKKYTITFLNYDGSVIETKIYKEGETVQEPQTPTKPEDNNYTYTFIGWDKEVTNVTGNDEYIAQYNQEYKNYTVTFKDEDGTTLTTKTDYHYGDSVILPESNPSKQEDETYTYEFAGWDKEVSNVTGNEEYTAKYNKTYKNYTVTFKDENGNVISEKSDYHYGDSVIKPTQNPSKEDDNTYTYIFVGWDKDVSNVDGNATYTAVYDKKFIEYVVVFKQDTGEIINQTTYHYNEDLVVPEDPSKESTMSVAYKFLGWTPEVANKVTSNLEYTAQYEEKEINYNFIFINDDETEIERRTYKYGESIEFPVAEKEDTEEIKYVFKNWNNISTESISDTEINITFKAEYKEEYYVARLEEKGELEGKSYFTLQEAIRNAGRVPRTIRMLKDVEEAVIVDDDQEITLNLNGKAITGTKTYVIKNYGNLSIEDNSENKEGKVKVTSEEEIGYGIHNREGRLTVKSGLVAAETSIEEGTTYAIYNQSEEKVTIEGGSVLSEAKGEGAKSCGIYNQAGREIIVTGGVILGNAIGERSTTYGIYNETEGKVEVEEGTIQAKASLSSAISYGIYNKVSEEITISGGKIVAQSDRNEAYGVFNDEGKVTIGKTTNTLNKELEINVTANTGYGIYNNKGQILTTNEQITTENEQTVENSDLKITMLGTRTYGIYNNEGSLEITTGNIELMSTESYGIYNKNIMNVLGGKITTSATSAYLYGIYNYTNNENDNENEPQVNIENIEIKGLERGIYNTKGNVTIKGINIEETKEGIYTGEYSNKVTIESGTIKAIRNGIYNNIGTVVLKDVEIESNQYGVYNTNNGITEIGEKGSNISTEKPSIYGKTYGVYQDLNASGSIKFYDGILKGEQAIYGGIGEIENNTRIVLTTSENEETAILEQIPSNNVAKIGENYYTNLNDAIEAVEENKEETTTIEILANQQLSEVTKIPENKKVTIDLKGYEIETYAQGGLINKGTLEITDTNVDEQQTQGKIISNIGIAISNEGNLNLTSGTITSNNYGIYNYNDGKVVVNGGTVEGRICGIYNSSSQNKVEINSGKVTSEGYGISNSNGQEVKITGGVVEGKETGIRNYSGIVNVEGGEVRVKENTTSGNAIYSSYGQVNVKAGKVTNEVEGNTNNYSIYTTYSSLNITGGEIVGGVDTNETNLNIGTKDGTIDTNSPIILGKEYGVRLNTMGTRTQTFNYYDGKIGGIKEAYVGNINEIEEGKEIQTREETIGYKVYKTITLVDEIEYENGIAKIGDTTYKKVSELRNAINNLPETEEQTEVTILNNFETTRTIEIPQNRNVLIDLNGKEITMSSSIINRGNLEITDKTENYAGKIVNTRETAIINSTNKELKITKGNIESVKAAIFINSGKVIIGTQDENIQNGIVTIKGETSAITEQYSSNIVEMYDGTLIGKNSSQNIVDKTEEGYTAKTNKDGEYYETTIELEEPVARIGETDYYTVQEAIDNSNNGETIELLRTIDNQKTIIEIPEGKEITIDLKNYSINCNQEKTIINNGLLNVENGTIGNNKEEGVTIENNGTLNINSGNIQKTNVGTAIENKGILNINNGTIQGYSKGIDNKEGATLIIKGGIIQARERAINNESTKEINILGGTITNNSTGNTYYGIYNNVDSNINITGTAKIVNNNNNNQYGYGIYNSGKGNIVINTDNGITIENSKYGYGIYNNGEGNITLEKGTINVKNNEFLSYGIKNASNGKVEIVNGKIEVQSPKGVAYGIENGVSGEVEVQGGEIKAETQEGISYGINNISIPVLKVIGGKITAKGEQSYGIYNNSSDLQLGEKDNIVDINNPTIDSENVGIFINSEDSRFNFYDGKIIGKTAINVEVTVEEGYKTRKTTLEDNREEIFLMEQDSFIATFWNEDKTEIIAQVPFKATDKKINEPTPPTKEGYDGLWEEYEIKAEDIEIKVYYVEKKPNGQKFTATDKNGITWNYTYQDGKATNVYYQSGTVGETVEIPSHLDGYEVISIQNTSRGYNRNIFTYKNYGTNNTIKEVILPETLTSIGNNAFYNCKSLENVEIGDSLTNIGNEAFCGCTSLTEVEIRDSVTSIGNYAFNNCTGLTGVEIGDSVTTIGDGAFCNCTSLTQIDIPNNVTSIGNNAFYNCKSLENVEIGDSLTSIGSGAFNNCTSLTEINIPEGVTSIGGNAFRDCTSLTEINIPHSVTSIGNYAFSNCTSLGEVEIGNSVTSIGDGAFRDCTSLTEINIPHSVTVIEDNAFFNCTSLTKVEIGNSVTSIGSDAFCWCTSLTQIEIPNSVTSIGNYAFSNCTSLTSIEIPNSVTSIGDSAFGGCTSLIDIYINNEEENITLGNDWNYNAYVHYSDCKHSITTEITDSNITIEGVSNNLEEGKIRCLEDYKFKLLNENAEVIRDKIIIIKSQKKFTNSGEIQEILVPDKDGIYTIENVNRNKTIKKIVNGENLICTDNNGITWNYTYQDGKATNVYYESGELGETVEIPSHLNGYPVISIQNTSGGYSRNIFTKTNSASNNTIKEVVLPETLTSIGNYAFYNCKSLTNVEIGDSVTSIGESAFSGCKSLSEIEIPNSVTSIGGYAFSHCTSLTNVEIGDSVTSIGYQAFYNCTSLSKIEIPNSVTSIGNYAFDNCTSLSEIEIPNSVTSIGGYAFSHCTSLTNIDVDNMNSNYSSKNGILYDKNMIILYTCPEGKIGKIIIPDSVTSIGSSAFSNCKSLTNVVVGDSVTSIGSSAFYNCTSLSKIEIPNSVTSIGSSAFYNCTSLSEIEIPNSVTSIGSNAFSSCTSLTNVVIGDSVTSIGSYAFSSCTSLSEIEIPDSVTSIGDGAFSSCTSLTEIEIPNSVTSIGDWAFYNCTSLSEIEIGDSVTSIGSYAFTYCSSLTSIEIPDSVTSIGDTAFDNCTSLTEIEIPNSVTSIGEWAFYNCTSLSEIEIPNSVTSIGNYAFNSCTSLTEINIPNSVTSIGNEAFRDCTSLSEIEIGDSVTSIGGSAFSNCTSLTSIEIPNSVTSIGNQAFYYCTSLTNVEIGDSVTSIGEWAFYNCESLSEIEIPNSVTSIGDSAFCGCKSLINVEISNSVTSIGYEAFSDCTRLSEIEIPNSVTSIGSSAFYDWTNNQTINIYAKSEPSGWSDDWNSNCSANIVWGYTGK